MSQFTFNDYQQSVAAAQSRGNSDNQSKVGYFKLSDDGDEAIARINIATVDDMHMTSLHNLGAAENYASVNCIAAFDDYSGNSCPFCAAAKAGNASIGAAKKRIIVPMIVSYKDRATGQWSAPVAVTWDRPAGFARELANKIRDFGDLRHVLLKITRNGAKRDMKTTYSVEYAVPTIFKPEMIPEDFSAFENNFSISRHSYRTKTVEEMNTFIMTGAFPEVNNNNDTATINESAPSASAYQQTTTFQQQTFVPPAQPQTFTQPVQSAPVFNTAPQPQQVVQPAAQTNAKPQFDFSNFNPKF